MLLSPHFSLEELTFSQAAVRLGIDNTPDAEEIANLRHLCDELLEPARLVLGVPLHVDSGYRSIKVNAQVGGDSASAHMYGRAADIIPINMSISEAFDRLRKDITLPYDKIIFECKAWIHIAIPPLGLRARRIAETATGHPGAWKYQLVGVTE